MKYIKYGVISALFVFLFVFGPELSPALQQLFLYIQKSWHGALYSVGYFLEALLSHMEAILFAVPVYVIAALTGLLGYAANLKIWRGVSFSVLVLLIDRFGCWDGSVYTVSAVIAVMSVSLIIGIPIGIILSAGRRRFLIINPILNAMQILPNYVYLIPSLMLLGSGIASGVMAAVIYSIPPVISLTAHAIRRTDPKMREAAIAFGATNWQSIIRVELPQAMPTIAHGVNRAAMLALSMVVITSIIGSQGLGLDMLGAMQDGDIGRVVTCGICLVFITIIIDYISKAMSAIASERRQGGAGGA